MEDIAEMSVGDAGWKFDFEEGAFVIEANSEEGGGGMKFGLDGIEL